MPEKRISIYLETERDSECPLSCNNLEHVHGLICGCGCFFYDKDCPFFGECPIGDREAGGYTFELIG
jgi:hypothetical protein